MEYLMSCEQIEECIFKLISNLGYNIYNVEEISSYNTRKFLSFRLSKLGLLGKHWKFGMYIDSNTLNKEYFKPSEEDYCINYNDYGNTVVLFAQYDTQIDKFKESYSSLSVSYNAYNWKKGFIDKEYKCPFPSLKYMLKMIKKHPLLSYHGLCGKNAGFYDGNLLIDFLMKETEFDFNKFKRCFISRTIVSYTKAKCFFAKNSSIIDKIIISSENNGFRDSCEVYTIEITFTKNATDEEICNWLNKWFHKNEYGKLNKNFYDYAVKLAPLRQIGYEGTFTME